MDRIVRLNLSSNPSLKDAGFKLFLSYLRKTQRLRELDLTNTNITDCTGFLICHLLPIWKVETLNLSSNKFTSLFYDKIAEILQTPVPQSDLLPRHSYWNQYEEFGDSPFTLRKSENERKSLSLLELNLSNNKIGERAGIILIKAVITNSEIEIMELSKCNLKFKFGAYLLNLLMSLPKSEVHLEKINLSYNAISKSIIEGIGGYIANTEGTEISIDTNNASTNTSTSTNNQPKKACTPRFSGGVFGSKCKLGQTPPPVPLVPRINGHHIMDFAHLPSSSSLFTPELSEANINIYRARGGSGDGGSAIKKIQFDESFNLVSSPPSKCTLDNQGPLPHRQHLTHSSKSGHSCELMKITPKKSIASMSINRKQKSKYEQQTYFDETPNLEHSTSGIDCSESTNMKNWDNLKGDRRQIQISILQNTEEMLMNTGGLINFNTQRKKNSMKGNPYDLLKSRFSHVDLAHSNTCFNNTECSLKSDGIATHILHESPKLDRQGQGEENQGKFEAIEKHMENSEDDMNSSKPVLFMESFKNIERGKSRNASQLNEYCSLPNKKYLSHKTHKTHKVQRDKNNEASKTPFKMKKNRKSSHKNKVSPNIRLNITSLEKETDNDFPHPNKSVIENIPSTNTKSNQLPGEEIKLHRKSITGHNRKKSSLSQSFEFNLRDHQNQLEKFGDKNMQKYVELAEHTEKNFTFSKPIKENKGEEKPHRKPTIKTNIVQVGKSNKKSSFGNLIKISPRSFIFSPKVCSPKSPEERINEIEIFLK